MKISFEKHKMNSINSSGIYPVPFKMVILFLMLFVTCFFSTISAQNEKITLKLKNKTLSEVINEIEVKSGYSFLVRNNDVNLKEIVSIEVVNKSIEEILTQLFKQRQISFEIMGKSVSVFKPQKNQDGSPIRHTRKITGYVTDSNGDPVIGATVIELSTKNGTITDIGGAFVLEVSEKSIVQVSYIGYTPAEIKIGNQNNLTIRLKESTKILDELVVIGYGTIKKKDLTGAVTTISSENITNRKTTQLSTALQGAMSGVMVTRNSNEPGSTGTIKVRGITTISNSDPLVIVDGVPASINDINPNDVENISVLKDAASAAIYGARAASGVIVVTTKRAESDKLSINYTFEQGIDMVNKDPQSVDVKRFMEMANELTWNDAGNGNDKYPLYSDYTIQNYNQLHAENPDLYPDTDWRSLILNKYASKQSHIFGISGGTKAVRTKVGIVYDKIGGLYQNKDYERLTLRVNNDFVINKFISAALDVNFKQSNNTNPISDPMDRVRIAAPVYAALWQDGRIGEGKSGDNAYAALMYGGISTNRYNQFGGKLSLSVTPLENLKFTAIVSPTLNYEKGKNFTQKINYTAASDATNIIGTISGHSATSLIEKRNDINYITTQFLGNYNKETKAGNFNAMVGYESYYYFNESLSASRDQYELSSYPYLDNGPLELRDNSGNAYEIAYESVFGRLIYSYKSKYLFQANLRYDASSRFAPEYRWGAFPSFSTGWVISEENFMKDIPVLSYLKIRGSWGSLGNERIGTYPYQSTIIFTSGIFYQGTTKVSKLTAAQQQFAIRDITWETTETFDVGVDLNFFKNKLKLTADYYQKTTKDMLLAIEIPDYIGYENPDQNTGRMYTKGFDFELGWNDKIGNWRYGASFNLSDFRSIMGDLGGTEFLGNQIKKEGSEYNEWYGYVSNGLFQTSEEVSQSAKLNDNTKPGDIKYVDLSGPDGIPDGKISPEYDRVLLGGSLPRFMYGGVISGGYKEFDISVTMQGIGKQLVNTYNMAVPYSQGWGNMPKNIDGKYWSVNNTAEQNLKAEYPRLTRTGVDNNYILSDFWLKDGSYFRLKNITLSYTYVVPADISKNIGINRIKGYISGTDLFSIDNYPTGWDPELGGMSSYPVTSSVVAGISINL